MKTKILNKDIRVVNINTTAFEEEDFLILTNLTNEQIKRIIEPILQKERNDENNFTYDNDILLNSLIKEYKNNYIIKGIILDYLTL